MTYKELKHEIKEEQKTLAKQITNGKIGRKPKNRTAENEADYDKLFWNQWTYRHRHIIYCQLFNNTPYALIEQPRNGNKPSSHKLDGIKQEWEAELDEQTIRDCT
ncbi:hypothetical protein KAR91_68670 [Candidatus Pacearchaeota archaeon]|nr:hypothetical protein [Candidatus Pacearchaeota archaeon]